MKYTRKQLWYKRQHHLRSLCIKWLRQYEPEILSQLREECEKVYPLPGGHIRVGRRPGEAKSLIR